MFFPSYFLDEVQSISNVLVSAVQESDSVIHEYTFFSIMVYHRLFFKLIN